MPLQIENAHAWIDDIAGFDPGLYASSTHGCIARILELLGEPLSYADLLVYSGFAFRVQVHDQMCPSAGHPFCGYPCLEGCDAAIPWHRHMLRPPEGIDPVDFQMRAREEVRASIDRGIPVHYGLEEDGLIIGYAGQGKRWWCLHPYHKQGTEAFWYDEVEGFAGGRWPWGLMIWSHRKHLHEIAEPSDLLRNALRQAIAMWEAGLQDGHYFVGKSAYEQWIGWLRKVQAGHISDPQAGMQGNAWGWTVLLHSRRTLGEWLRAHAANCPPRIHQPLARAAQHYSDLTAITMDGYAHPAELPPWSGQADQWTEDQREKQIARLESARQLDQLAIECLQEALEQFQQKATMV